MDERVSSAEYQITTHSVDETRKLGETIGAVVTAGTVLALYGDLGSGKTSFVQGLGRGLGVPDDYYITSPSYTLINEYPGRYLLFHIDLYRIANPVDIEDIGLYEILEEDGVVAIEWAERIRGTLPPEGITIRFNMISDDTRNICVTAYGLQAANVQKVE